MSSTNALSIDSITGETSEVVIISEIAISRRHYEVLVELAALNEMDLARFISEELEFVVEDMAFNDPEHIAKLMVRKWEKALGKEE
jgi:hypothetical protein